MSAKPTHHVTGILRSVAAALAFTYFCAPESLSAGQIYALVVGIDNYQHIASLKGAVNDAKDVSGALTSMGAKDIRLLIDEKATREAIFGNWAELTAAASMDDTLIFHYAGHGGREDAILDGHEEKDNMFILHGFRDAGLEREQRIVDNEIGHLLAMEQEATVLFVADSCFAGGMVRSLDSRVNIGLRTTGVKLTGVDDNVTKRVRYLGEVDRAALSHVIWLYAQDDNKVTQEMSIDGQTRGALSYAFSRALRGEADQNGDARIDVPELKRFVNRTVTRLSERRQRPQVNAGSPELSVPLPRATGTLAVPVEPPEMRIFFSDGKLPFDLVGSRAVQSQNSADLIFSTSERVLIYKTGDVVAEFDQRDSEDDLAQKLQGAIDKWRLLELLATIQSTDDPRLVLTAGDRLYRYGEKVQFKVESATHGNITLFNLAYDGTVQLLAPNPRFETGLEGGRLTVGKPQEREVKVMPPFGADHLVAITSAVDVPDLDAAVSINDGKRHAIQLSRELGQILQRGKFGITVVALYTKP